jgi:hypothetical protein
MSSSDDASLRSLIATNEGILRDANRLRQRNVRIRSRAFAVGRGLSGDERAEALTLATNATEEIARLDAMAARTWRRLRSLRSVIQRRELVAVRLRGPRRRIACPRRARRPRPNKNSNLKGDRDDGDSDHAGASS